MFHSHHPRRHFNSFRYAFSGLKHAFVNEANFRVQVLYFIVCVLAATYFNVSALEWVVLGITAGMLISGEIMNTVIEEFIDHLIKEHHEGARVIKDLSAAYVLITAMVAVGVFMYVFGGKFLGLLQAFVNSNY